MRNKSNTTQPEIHPQPKGCGILSSDNKELTRPKYMLHVGMFSLATGIILDYFFSSPEFIVVGCSLSILGLFVLETDKTIKRNSGIPIDKSSSTEIDNKGDEE